MVSVDGIAKPSRTDVVRGSALSAVAAGSQSVMVIPSVCIRIPTQSKISKPTVTKLRCRAE